MDDNLGQPCKHPTTSSAGLSRSCIAAVHGMVARSGEPRLPVTAVRDMDAEFNLRDAENTYSNTRVQPVDAPQSGTNPSWNRKK